MAGLLPWLGKGLQDFGNGIGGFVNGAAHTVGDAVNNVEHAVGGAVNGVEQGVNNFVHPQAPQPPQVGMQRPQTPSFRPAMPTVANFNAATASRNSVVHQTQPATNPFKGIGDFANGVGGFVHDAANAVVNDAKPVINTIGGTGAAAIGAVTGQNNNPYYRAQVTDMLNHGIVPHDVMTGKATPGQFATNIAQTGIHYAPYAIGGGGALTDKLGATVANKVGTGVASKIAGNAANYGANAAISAPTFAGLNAAQQGLETGKFDPMQALQAGGQAALMTAGGALAHDVAKVGAKSAVKGAVKAYNSPQDGFAKLPNKPIEGQQPLFDTGAQKPNDAIQAPKQPNAPQSYKYKAVTENGTTQFNNLDKTNSFQDINGIQHPIGSNAKIAVNNFNGTNETKVFNVPNIGSQKYFNNQLVKYGQQGKIAHVSIDETPSLVKPNSPKAPIQKANINDAANALGTTPEQLAKNSSTDYTNPVDRGEPSPNQKTTASRQSPQGKAGQTGPSTPGFAADSRGGAGGDRPPGANPKEFSSSNSKYNTNPQSVNIDEVKPGDYQKVRSNVQRTESNVNVRARQAIHSINRLSPDEKAKFWHVVEGTAQTTGPKMNRAINDWRNLSDYVHASSQALGGDTPHIASYARHNWDLTDPTEAQRFTDMMNAKFGDTSGRTVNPEDFKGLDNKPRAFDTIKEGQGQGFKLKNEGNPAQDIQDYAQSATSKLKTAHVSKGMAQAESHLPESEKGFSQHIGYKQNILVSQRGAHELRSLFETPQPKFTKGQKVVAYYDKANRGVKATVLSLSQFHTANIGLQSIPTLIAKGHPIRAINAALDTVGVTFSPKAADGMINAAIKDGTIDDAARIGTPILEGNDFNVSGKLDLNAARGEKLIFERQLPAMHIQMVKAVVSDLKKKGIPLDSAEARAAGNEIHQIMGYVNKTLNNMSSRNMRAASRVMLAPNFTRSKWAVLKDAFTKGGQAGSYARRAVIGKYAAEAALIMGIGAIMGQKSDDWKDTLLRALIHPSIPTPMKDSKGNTMELSLPANYLSEAAGLVSSLDRGTDGRLGVNVDPTKIPQNLVNYGQGRLAAIPATALKIATNQNYAGRPLYDPAASLGSRVAQAATTLGVGALPIGLQNLAYTGPVKDALGNIPGVGGDIKNVLNAETPGANPLLKGVLSAAGMTPRTDKTVGQGLQTTQYFNALDHARQGLNTHETDIFKQLTDSKKNPVTGQYDTTPTVYDTTAKANDLLQNPNVLYHLTTMNQSLQQKGQAIDPFYNLTPQQQTQVLQINRLDPGNPDKTQLQNVARKQQWYNDFQTAQSTFFNNLPAGDPNRPQAPVQYKAPSPQAQNLADQYYKLTDPTQKANFIKNNPGVQEAFDATATYDAAIRAARGDPALKGYPKASSALQQKLNTYDQLPTKSAKSSYGKANPDIYSYFQQVSQYNLENDAKQASYVGNNFTQKGAKAITSLANSIKYDGGLQDSNGNLIAGTGSGGSFGSSGGRRGGRRSKGITTGKRMSALIRSTNKIRVPKTTGTATAFSGKITLPKMTKTGLKGYTVAKTPKISTRKKAKTSFA